MPMPYPPPYGYPQQMSMPPQYGYPQQMPMSYPQPMSMPPQYGYPQQMPMPYPQPNPMMIQPRVFPVSKPMMQAPMPAPLVHTFGPLMSDPINENSPVEPQAEPNLGTIPVSHGKRAMMLPNGDVEVLPEACGPEGCDHGPPPVRPLPARGRGHFISTLGVWFLAPYPGNNTAFTTTTGGATSATEFSQEMLFGPRASFGYVFHNCWGLRGNYSYLNGDVTQTANNGNVGTTIATPVGGAFQVDSPSAALAAGLAPDRFNFRQNIEVHIADVELLREANILDTSFLFSMGARYVRFEQSYEASRSNPGGTAGATSVALSQEDLATESRFNGWGPTISLDVAHPIFCRSLSMYGNVRGSYLFGNHRYTQDYRNQSRTTTGAATTFTDTSLNSVAYDNRAASVVEAEAGLQYGARVGRCYLFGRAGAVYQRWWDVGTPVSGTGNLSFVGGTASVGITY
jgi:hypothetical protein